MADVSGDNKVTGTGGASQSQSGFMPVLPLLPVLSAVLAWLSYPPADVSWLAWAAYAPLIFYIYVISGRGGFFRRGFVFLSGSGFRALRPIYLGGFLFFLLGLFWLRHVTWAGLMILPLILALYWTLFGLAGYFIFRYFSTAWAVWLLPAVWVCLEYLRSLILTGFPWLFAGHSQYARINLIQISDITGVYGISFLVILVNAVIFLLVLKRFKAPVSALMAAAAAALLLSGAVFYGQGRLAGLALADGPVIGIVQANIEQSLKNIPASAQDIYRRHVKMTYDLLEASPQPDLVVWAETMFPLTVGLDEKALPILRDTAALCGSPMLVGALTAYKSSDPRRKYDIFNSAYYLDGDGEVLGRYDKARLVPVSEYIPFRDTKIFRSVVRFLVLALSELPEVYGMLEGVNYEPFSLKPKSDAAGYKYGVLICYESIFPELARLSVQKGADFIINISNDGWFRDSSELEQILAISAFRAAENKVAFVRATNTGISAAILPSGQINICRDLNGRFKEVRGAWSIQLPVAGQKGTFYTRAGDYFPYLCLLMMAAIIALKYFKILDKTG